MAEVPDVIPGNDVEASWGNIIRDRTLQRYANAGARTASVPVPVEGDFSYLLDTDSVEVFDGTDWVPISSGGDFLPLAGGTMDLGAVIGQILNAKFVNVDGVASGFIEAFPGADRVVFRVGAGDNSGETDQTFFQLIGADDIAAASFGVRFGAVSGMNVEPGGVRLPEGSVGVPALSFQSTLAAGLFRNAQGDLTSVGNFSLIDNRLYMTSPDGVSNGYYFFANVSDGADFGFSIRAIDDTEIVQMRANGQYFIPGVYATTTGNAANVEVASDGLLRRSTSARRYKTKIRKLVTKARQRFLEAKLPDPVEFKHKGNQQEYLGFIAEEVAELDPRLGVYNDAGEIENYDLRGLVAVLTARLIDAEKRLDDAGL